MSFKWIDGKVLTVDQLREIAKIDNEVPTEFDPSWIADEAALKERLEFYEKLSDKDFFQTIYSNSEIIGFHIVRGSKSSIAHVGTLWVHPKYRKQGLGRTLKEKGVDWAKANGFTHLQTGVHKKNVRMNEINLQNGYELFSTIYRLKLSV